MSPGSYYRGWDLGLLGGQNLKKNPKNGRVAYQIEGDGKQNGIQVKCSGRVASKALVFKFVLTGQ